ncbi:MAG TPA: NAD(P)/FAD-dependent oxidoreductase [Acidimicrobiia bacterium]
MKPPRVVVVGAGFGGITAAKALARYAVEVTIIDRHNFHTFSPLLYQVATAGLAPDDIAPNVRGIVQSEPNVETLMATVRGVDFARREVLLDEGFGVPYDYLVLAAGAVSSDFGVPGVEEHALPLKTLADATHIRSTVLSRFEEVNTDPTAAGDDALTFVVSGGGPTGVELSGALAELFSQVLAKDYKNLDVGRARVVLVEMADRLLGTFSPQAGHEARVELEMRGVDVRLGVRIASVDAGGVHLADGTTIAARTVIWTAGVKANPLAGMLGLEQTARGEIVIGSDLTVPGHPEVFVVGDLGAVEDKAGKPLPQLAPVAMQQGRHVARTIDRRMHGKPAKPFRYFDKGTMATIGRRSAVAELPLGIKFSGTLGWLSWLGLHLVFLIGFRNRVLVLVNWAWNYVSWERGNRVILGNPD